MTTVTTKKTKFEEMSDKMKFVYKWHNGLVLEKVLRGATKDETFKFIRDENDYTFINEEGKKVIIDNEGDIVKSDIKVPSVFIETCQNRLSKTNEILKAIYA